MTEFSELVGERTMNCVPIMDARHPFDPDASAVAFNLDGTWYLATEDPEDGYRSYMGTLMPTVSPDYGKAEYIYEKVVVEALESDPDVDYEGRCDILAIKSAVTGRVIFKVGTNNTDDYYPYFVGSWHPENLAANQNKD